MNNQELKNRIKIFAHRCVKLAISLPGSQLGRHISGQLIRCSTSVAVNYRAACVAQSKVSFKAKISIVLEEADETYFWLEFIIDEELIVNSKINDLFKEANELVAIFYSTRKSLTKN